MLLSKADVLSLDAEITNDTCQVWNVTNTSLESATSKKPTERYFDRVQMSEEGNIALLKFRQVIKP